MKKFLMLACASLVVAGCGAREEAKPQGVKETRNYVSEGMNYLNKSDVRNALRSFDMAIQQDPKNQQNYIVLGQVYLRLRQFTRAVDTFQAATRVNGENGELYYLLAMSKEMQGGKHAEAIEDAKRSAQIFEKNRDEQGFKKALTLLKNLTENKAPEAVEAQQ